MPNKKKIWKKMFWIGFFVVTAYLILALKLATFDSWNFVYIYSIFVTTFMFSRIGGSFLYENYVKKHEKKKKEKTYLFGALMPLFRAKEVENDKSPEINFKDYEPTVSFVIPCKNEEKEIYNTMKSCVNVKYPKQKIEVIAVNDGSTDNTLNEMLKAQKDFPNNVKVINLKVNVGKRKAMAAGIRIAKNEIVVQIDSDSQPDAKTFKKVLEPFADPEVGSTVGHTLPANTDKNLLTKMQNAYYFMSFRALKATESIFDMVFCCSGCFCAYRKEYLDEMMDDWLNERFFGKEIIFGDDRALTNWMIRKNYKTVYVAEAEAITVVPETLKTFLKQQVRWKKGWMINSFKIAPTIVKKDKFVAFTYFLPLILLTILTPLIAFKALILNPLFLGISPWFYMLGIMLVALMLFAHYNIYEGGKYGKYMIAWSILNMTILSYVLVYAVYDLKNMKWGTR
jgi:hyaluronan synthase